MPAYPVTGRFSLPLENDQREAAEDIAIRSGQSITTVLKLAIGLGLPRAREAMCPTLPPLTDEERAQCYADMSAEDMQLDRAMGEASLAAQGRA